MPEKSSPRDVRYEINVHDKLPSGGSVGSRPSAIEDNLTAIVAEHEAGQHRGKWRMIASYRVASAAGAAANILRRRHGDSVDVEGWEFATARDETPGENGAVEVRRGLFARYEPEKIVAGAAAKFEAKLAAKDAALAAKRDAKKAPEGSAAKAAAPTAAKG